MLISDATFVVVDTETTGFDYETDRLIEIAAVKMRKGRVTAEFSALINPECLLSRRITSLTGITSAMVAAKPTAAAVLPRFLAFLGSSVFVAHHLSFDRAFINRALERAEMPRLPNPMLCTERLARRLLHGLPSKGLDSLIRFFGYTVEDRHRALADAHVTAKIFSRFIEQVGTEHDVTAVQDLLRFQYRTFRTIRAPAANVGVIRAQILPRIPECPGVYFIKGKQGRIIYIGKAKNLRRRVSSYFAGLEGHVAHTRKMVAAARDVEWTETETELEAVILESRSIKEHTPRFNRAERKWVSRPFVRLSDSGGKVRISTSVFIQHDGAEYWGPFRDRDQAECAVEVMVDQYGVEPDRRQPPGAAKSGVLRADSAHGVREFLAGRDQTVFDLLEDRMKEAAESTDFEEAAILRDRLMKLDWVASAVPLARLSVFDRNAAVVDERRHVFLILQGRLVDTLSFSQPPSPSDKNMLLERVHAYCREAQQHPPRYLDQEVDEIRIVAEWLHQARDRIRIERWTDQRDPESFARAVLAICTDAVCES